MPAELSTPLDDAAEALRDGRLSEAIEVLGPLLDGEDATPWVVAACCAERLGDLAALQRLLTGALERQQQLSNDWQQPLVSLTFRASCYGGRPTAPQDALGALVARVPWSGASTLPPWPLIEAMAANLARLGQLDALDALTGRRAAALHTELPVRVESAVRQVLGRWPLADEPDFVFVGGCPRSGTTLFRAMLDAHPALHAPPELKLVRELGNQRKRWWKALGSSLQQAGVDEQRLDAACRAFVEVLLTGLGPGRMVEKTPGNLQHLTWLAGLFPRARFIHVVRDGRAVATSLMRVNWTDPRTGRSVWYCESLENAAKYWASSVDEVQRQAARVPGRVLEVRYEDLVQAPEPTLRRVMAFLGEPFDEAMLAHHQAGVNLPAAETSSAAVAQPVNTRAAGAWRGILGPERTAIVEAHAGATLRRLGYR